MPRARALSAGWRIPHPIVCIADPDYSCDPLAPVRTVLAVYGEQDLPSDPQWASTAVIVPLDNNVIDYSPLAHTMVLAGGGALTATRSRYGSVAYENTSSDPASCISTLQADITYDPLSGGGSDLVVECQVWLTTKAVDQVFAYLPGGYRLWYRQSTDEIVLTGTSFTIGTSYSPPTGQWVALAVLQRGNNGFNNAYAVYADGDALIGGSGAPWIGGFLNQRAYFGGDGSASPLIGGLSQCRLTITSPNSTGRLIQSHIVPPYALPQGYHPLLHDCSCANPKTVALAGYATPQATYRAVGRDLVYVPAVGGGSTENGVIVSGHADFDFGVEDFSIEMYVERFSNAASGHVFWYEETGGEFSARVDIAAANKLSLLYRSSGGAQAVTTNAVFPLDTLQHLNVQRRTITGVPYWETYLNGVRVDQTAVAGGAASTVNLAGDIYFGRKNVASPNPINGAIGQLHVVRGRAIRTGDFTPPALPFCCHGL